MKFKFKIISVVQIIFATLLIDTTFAQYPDHDPDCGDEDNDQIGECEGLVHGESMIISNNREYSSSGSISTSTRRQVIVTQTGNLKISAVDRISLKYGFIVEGGGVLQTRILSETELHKLSGDLAYLTQEDVDLGEDEYINREKLIGVFPNPFYTQVNIKYKLNRYSNVRIEIYDILGRKIRLLKDGIQAPGEYIIHWSPSETKIDKYPNSIYLCNLVINGKLYVEKMVKIR